MKFTKFWIFSVATLMVTFPGGCSLDKGEMTSYVNANLNNIVIDESDLENVAVQPSCQYTFSYDETAGTVKVSTSGLKIGTETIGFDTDEIKYSQIVSGSGYVKMFNGDGSTTTSPVQPITGLHGVETTLFYYYPTAIPGVIGVSPIDMQMLLYYKVDDKYTVKTFPTDSYFGGITTTHYAFQGQSQMYESKDAVFRVKFSEDLKTATVVIYNVRFAEQMPSITIALKDLDVTYSATGYTITGENIVALMPEGDGVTAFDARPFTSFKFYTEGDYLVAARCEYTVHDNRLDTDYYGSFSGKYAETGDTAGDD